MGASARHPPAPQRAPDWILGSPRRGAFLSRMKADLIPGEAAMKGKPQKYGDSGCDQEG